MRDAYLAEHPYCEDHLRIYGQPVPAAEVHHLAPMLDRPDLALNETNLIALCHDCHNARHGKGIGGQKAVPSNRRPPPLHNFMTCEAGNCDW
ncbi:MAG: hypothetical protein GXY58_19455 [Planctomycetaceae bacterium]|nr:hypothetical protein [Planctomycetaceae bacterium]